MQHKMGLALGLVGTTSKLDMQEHNHNNEITPITVVMTEMSADKCCGDFFLLVGCAITHLREKDRC